MTDTRPSTDEIVRGTASNVRGVSARLRQLLATASLTEDAAAAIRSCAIVLDGAVASLEASARAEGGSPDFADDPGMAESLN